MTANEILEQARKLSPQELEELLQRLQAMQAEPPVNRPKTGAEMWVKQIRRDQRQRRLGDWGQDK